MRNSALLFLCSLFLFASNTSLRAADETVTGKWKAVITYNDQSRDYTLQLKQDGKKVGGVLTSPRSGDYKIKSGSFEGGKLKIEVPREFGGQEVLLVITAKRGAKGGFEGELTVDGQSFGDVKLTPNRPKYSFVGKWNVLSKSPDESQEWEATVDAFNGKNEKLGGIYKAQPGSFDLNNAEVKDGKVSFEVTMTINDNDITFTVNAEFKTPHKLVGKWHVNSNDEINGYWSATRDRSGELAGDWNVRSQRSNGEAIEFVLSVRVEKGTVAVTAIVGKGKKIPVTNASIEGGKLRGEMKWEADGSVEDIEFEGSLDEKGGLRGSWAGGGEKGEWNGSKAKKAAKPKRETV